MFYALPKGSSIPVYVNDVYDPKATFYCLNPECKAEFRICSSDGTRSKHFRRRSSTQHCPNCMYDLASSQRYLSKELIKFQVNEIYQGNQNSSKSKDNSITRTYGLRETSLTEKALYVRTPKQLLEYCLVNSIYEQYDNTAQVRDIIIDSRTVLYKNYFKGFSGIKFVVGNVINYNKADNSISFAIWKNIKTPKEFYIKAKVTITDNDTFYDIVKHLLKKNPKISKNQIAVLGNWTKTDEGHITCQLKAKKNLIYNF